MEIHNTTAGLLINLPLDEIRDNGAVNLAENGLPQRFPITGAPQIHYDYYMGSSVAFSGAEEISLTGLVFPKYEGITAEWWFNATPAASGISCLLSLQDADGQPRWSVSMNHDTKKLHLHSAANTYELLDKPEYDRWIHLAITLDLSGNVKCIVNGSVMKEILVRELATTSSKYEFRIFIGSGGNKQYFDGKISQFKLFSRVLQQDELEFNMNRGLSINAKFKETYPIDFRLNSVDDGSENPVLYIETEGKGHPLKLDIINASATDISFWNADQSGQPLVPSENSYHVQLRFKKQVLAETVWKEFASERQTADQKWKYIGGSNDSLHEDWISLVRTGAGEIFSGLLGLALENISANALAGARNTLVEIKYNNLSYKNSGLVLSGSLTRHLDIISHLGSKNVPFEAGLIGDATILNDGSQNSIKILIANVQDTAIRFKSKQGAAADYSKFILHARDQNLFGQKPSASLQLDGDQKYFTTVPSASGQWSLTFECQAEVSLDKAKQLVLELRDFTTSATGKANLWLEYRNIPGFWDGRIPVTLNFSRLTERNSRIGINTNQPQADFHVKGSSKFEGTTQFKGNVNIDASVAANSIGVNSLKISGTNISEKDGKTLKIDKRIQDQTGYLMPVGSVIAYAGREVPEGWLTCDGRNIDIHIKKTPQDPDFDQLKLVLGGNVLPNLMSRFILGATTDTAKPEHFAGKTGGKEKVQLTKNEMPKHRHTLNFPKSADISEDKQGWPDKGYDSIYATDRMGVTSSSPVSEEGGDAAHENMPPFYALTYIIKY